MLHNDFLISYFLQISLSLLSTQYIFVTPRLVEKPWTFL